MKSSAFTLPVISSVKQQAETLVAIETKFRQQNIPEVAVKKELSQPLSLKAFSPSPQTHLKVTNKKEEKSSFLPPI